MVVDGRRLAPGSDIPALGVHRHAERPATGGADRCRGRSGEAIDCHGGGVDAHPDGVPHPVYSPRGTPISVLNRCRALAELGHEVDLVTYPMGEDVPVPGLHYLGHVRPG